MRHAALFVVLSAAVTPAFAGQLGPDKTNPVYLQDRGTGVSTSMFGTYVRKNELIVYPFFEYYRDSDFEYKPEELGALATWITGDGTTRARACSLSGTVSAKTSL